MATTNKTFHLFTLNLHNEVVAFASNFEEFIDIVHNLLPITKNKSLADFLLEFKKQQSWLLMVSENEIYTLQQVC